MERHVQMEGIPKPQLRIARITTAHQHIHSRIVLAEQVGSDMRADVAGRSGQEYRHVAPFVPVFMPFPFSVGAGICSTRGSRASTPPPSIYGYVRRRQAGLGDSIQL